MNYGFVRVATAIPNVKVADCKYNCERIYNAIQEAGSKGVSIIAFPELTVTGYTCGDLFAQSHLLRGAEE